MSFCRFVDTSAKKSIWQCKLKKEIPNGTQSDILAALKIHLALQSEDDLTLTLTLTRDVFDPVSKLIYKELKYVFENEFVHTKEFSELQQQLDSKDKYLPLPLNRKISAFPENSTLFLVVVNPDLTQKDIKLSKKKNTAMIGRDCANTVVLDDAHVSRSHARINYTHTGLLSILTSRLECCFDIKY